MPPLCSIHLNCATGLHSADLDVQLVQRPAKNPMDFSLARFLNVQWRENDWPRLQPLLAELGNALAEQIMNSTWTQEKAMIEQ